MKLKIKTCWLWAGKAPVGLAGFARAVGGLLGYSVKAMARWE